MSSRYCSSLCNISTLRLYTVRSHNSQRSRFSMGVNKSRLRTGELVTCDTRHIFLHKIPVSGWRNHSAAPCVLRNVIAGAFWLLVSRALLANVDADDDGVVVTFRGLTVTSLIEVHGTSIRRAIAIVDVRAVTSISHVIERDGRLCDKRT